ncbi:Vps54-like protein-domain-containing protein [Amylocarpus encephaloides]|uniref:Vacuolar protein sorting-associated protein 54 n=1 Tax=Amylocarpus encephaloides TaxID=45428 RepID=A0A9P8C5H4_9HELO|nr:Vps54-like protein-domain-containing protein [Amylocarpus encephaloides]
MASPTPRQSMDSLSPTSPQYRNEYPFPRPSSSHRYQPRRGSTASSIHSIGGSIHSIGGTLDTASNWHGLSESSQNAISTLLQPPIVRTGLLPHTSGSAFSSHKPPTSRDIPPVTLTNIQNIDPAEFKSYLSQVGGLYDALQRAKQNEDEGGTQLLRRGNKVDDFSDLLDSDGQSSSRPNLSKKASLASLASSIESPSLWRRSSGGVSRRAAHAPTPLATIPSVYFEEDFHLENPRTFDVVSERSEVVRPTPGPPDERRAPNGSAPGPRKALATNAILQEKLSWYMDTIEVHLISSISTASTSFFAALGSLRELHSEAADSVERIKTLRKELAELDQEMAIGGLDIVNKKRRRENLRQLGNAVQQLQRVVNGVAKCEDLVEKGEVEKALDTIDDLEQLIAGEDQDQDEQATMRLIDLRGATALQSVTSDMDTLRLRVGKAFETRFLNALLGDLRRHVESVSTSDTLRRWSSASQRSRGGHNREASAYPKYLTLGEDFRSELSATLNGLHRARYTSSATTAYREAVLREVRNLIRRPLPASNDDDADSMMSSSTIGTGKHKSAQEKSSILARNLRALDPDDAEDLLKKTYIGVGETLRRLGTQVKILLDITSTIADPDNPAAVGMKSPPRSPNIAAMDSMLSTAARDDSGPNIQEQMHQALDMSNLMGQTVDIAQEKIVKVLRVRSEQTTHLPVENFLRYFTLNLLFANECEAISGRSGTALKSVVNGHIKEYVQQLCDSQRQSLATGMDDDPWNAKDFTEANTEELSNILSASTQDAGAWSTSSQIWLPLTPPPPLNALSAPLLTQVNGAFRTSTPSGTTSKSVTRSAVIESESFILPLSAFLCLHGMTCFLHLNTGIPSMTSEIATSIISYLSLFNSRCTQLILGAGATRSAGLKNITTKHLALAAQALSFIGTLIPHVREFVRRHAGSGSSVSSLMGEFDKVRRAYLEHQQSIYDKLVDLMASRAAAHARSMKTIDWEEADTRIVNPYMETLTKETSTLHRVLNKHLPSMTVQMIMDPIFKSYKEQWGEAFGDVVLGSEGAQTRMLRDAEHFKTKIGGLDGAGDAGDYLVTLVKDKKVPKPKTPSPEATPKASTEKEIAATTNGESNGNTTPETNGKGSTEIGKKDAVAEKA